MPRQPRPTCSRNARTYFSQQCLFGSSQGSGSCQSPALVIVPPPVDRTHTRNRQLSRSRWYLAKTWQIACVIIDKLALTNTKSISTSLQGTAPQLWQHQNTTQNTDTAKKPEVANMACQWWTCQRTWAIANQRDRCTRITSLQPKP